MYLYVYRTCFMELCFNVFSCSFFIATDMVTKKKERNGVLFHLKTTTHLIEYVNSPCVHTAAKVKEFVDNTIRTCISIIQHSTQRLKCFRT